MSWYHQRLYHQRFTPCVHALMQQISDGAHLFVQRAYDLGKHLNPAKMKDLSFPTSETHLLAIQAVVRELHCRVPFVCDVLCLPDLQGGHRYLSLESCRFGMH